MESSAELSPHSLPLNKQNWISRDWSYPDSETSSVSRRPSIDRSRRCRQILPINRFDASENEKKTLKWNSKEEFTIEYILDCNLIDDNVAFHVKWQGYPHSANTWENLDKLRETVSLDEFLHDQCLVKRDEIKRIHNSFINRSKKQNILETLNEIKSVDEIQYKSHHLVYLLVKGNSHYFKNFKALYKKQFIFTHFQPLLVKEQKKYNNFIREIQEMDKFSLKFKVENLVDFGKLPTKFIYINNNKFQPSLTMLQKESKSGCNCGLECSTSCCCQPRDSSFSYSKKKKLLVKTSEAKMIYECNDACSCGIDCINRVTQQNPNLSLCLFKTINGRGWGVKTLKSIPTGNFVMEYTGEIIDFDEAERRGEKDYNNNGASYLFDLDFNGDSDVYTIDATHYGNMSRFFNHSCEPNCAIWPVSTKSAHKAVYKLCFFALRKILPNEELTFEYSGSGYVDDKKNQSEKREKCTCGAKKCRGYIFKI